MKNIKKMMASVSLMTVLMVSNAFADGVIVTGFNNQDNQPCTEQQTTAKKGVILSDFTGIILSDFTGVIVTGLTGVIVTGATDTPVNCGVIVTG